jgi:chlorophyll(ide) b reductase
MKDQPAGGHVFNMDGAGADGNATPRFAAYGATKRSLAQVGGGDGLVWAGAACCSIAPPSNPIQCMNGGMGTHRCCACLLHTHPHPQLGKSLEAELKLAKIGNVGIHNLSPGMVTTGGALGLID